MRRCRAGSLRRVNRLLTVRSDEALLDAARAGHRSVSTLVGRYRSELVRYATWLLDDDPMAQPVVDMALSHEQIIASAHPEIAPTARAVLYRLVHRAMADHLTRRADSTRAVPPASSRRHARLLTALRDLPFQPRAALLLREGAGLAREEVAHVLDLTTTQIEDLLVRARVATAEANARPDRTSRWRRMRRLVARRLRS